VVKKLTMRREETKCVSGASGVGGFLPRSPKMPEGWLDAGRAAGLGDTWTPNTREPAVPSHTKYRPRYESPAPSATTQSGSQPTPSLRRSSQSGPELRPRVAAQPRARGEREMTPGAGTKTATRKPETNSLTNPNPAARYWHVGAVNFEASTIRCTWRFLPMTGRTTASGQKKHSTVVLPGPQVVPNGAHVHRNAAGKHTKRASLIFPFNECGPRGNRIVAVCSVHEAQTATGVRTSPATDEHVGMNEGLIIQTGRPTTGQVEQTHSTPRPASVGAVR